MKAETQRPPDSSPAESAGGASDSAGRLDKWLWTVRVFKTRSLATEACRAGSVEIKGVPAKPSREVHPRDLVLVKLGLVTRTLCVLDVPERRIGAKLVVQFYQDLTTPEEYAKGKAPAVQHILARERGAGRPTKRERREIERFFE